MSYDLSIIIACYNCATILSDKVFQINEVLKLTRFSYEFIFVEDHSQDNTTEIIRSLAKKYQNSQVFYHNKNYGRGKTVSDGIKLAKGRIVGFNDIDLSTAPIYIPLLALEIDNGFDVVTAQRIYKFTLLASIRWILGKGYHFLVKHLLRLPLKDTEAGCKFFKKDKIIPVLSKAQDHGWFWDTEIMYYSYLAGLKIKEVPTLFIRDKSIKSTVRVFSDSYYYFSKLIKLVWDHRLS